MMKLKSNQTRTYDQDGYKKRAACVCFRSGAEDEVLLVSSSRYPDRWIVPGGGLEPEEDPSAAAIREVCEELMWLGVSTQKALSFEMCPVLQKKGLNPIVSVFHMDYRDKDLTVWNTCTMGLSHSSWRAGTSQKTGSSRRRLPSSSAARVHAYSQNSCILQAGVKGTLGRLLGVFENLERKHRTFVYVLTVTEVLDDWEDSLSIGRKRRWFSIEEAVHALQGHKPVQASYFQSLRQSCHPSNGSIPLSSHKPLPDVR